MNLIRPLETLRLSLGWSPGEQKDTLGGRGRHIEVPADGPKGIGDRISDHGRLTQLARVHPLHG